MFIFGGCVPCAICCSWKRRTSSPVAVSGRAAEKLGEGLDVPDIVVPGLLAELADRHVLQACGGADR